MRSTPIRQPSSSHISTMDASSGAAAAAGITASFPPQEASAMQPSAMQPSAMPPAYHFLYSQLAAAAAAQQGGAAPSAAPSATAAAPSAFPSNHALATDGLPRFDFTPPPNLPSAAAPQPTATRPQGTAAFASSSQHAARQAPNGGSERSGSTGAGHEPALARRTTTSLSLAAGLDLPSPAGVAHGPNGEWRQAEMVQGESFVGAQGNPNSAYLTDLLQQAQAQLLDFDQAGANLRLLGLTLPSAHPSLPDHHPLATPPPSSTFHTQAPTQQQQQQQQQQASPQSPQVPLQVLMQLHGLMQGPSASAHPSTNPLSTQQQSPAQVAQALALALGGGGEGSLQAQGGMHGGLELGAGMMGGSRSAPGTGAGAGGDNGGPMGVGMVGMDGAADSSAGGGDSTRMRQGLRGGVACSGSAFGGARGMGGFGGMGEGVGSGGCGQGEAQLFPQQWMAGGGVHTPMAAVQGGAARSNGGVSPSSALSPQSAPPSSAPLLSPHAPLQSPRRAQHRLLGAPGAAGAGGEGGGLVAGRREAGMGGAGVGRGAGGKRRMVEAADGVLCKVRAKRGQATHPRSIAERVRRSRISDKMKLLADLIPGMDRQVNAADMLEDAIEYVRHLQRQIEVVRSQHPDVHILPFVSRLDGQQGAGRVDEGRAEATDWDSGARGDGEGEEDERGIVRNGDGQSARGGAGVEGRMDGGGMEVVKDEHTGEDARDGRERLSGRDNGLALCTDASDNNHTVPCDRLTLSFSQL
ncbi:unnamed protein product [Closterium sp. NIES-54]